MFNIKYIDRDALNESFEQLNLNEYNVEFNLSIDEDKDVDCYLYNLDYSAKYCGLNHLICNILVDNFDYVIEDYCNITLKGVIKINSNEIIITFNRPIIKYEIVTTTISRKI